jgi:hypothetical protein
MHDQGELLYMQGSPALSLRVPPSFQADGIAHYIILHTEEGYKIKVSWDIGMIRMSCKEDREAT